MGRWLGIDSSYLDSFCGEEATGVLADALDRADYWEHNLDETHWFILDLGKTYSVQKVRGRSDQSDDPIDVDIYVSDSKASWGSAVATGISTWQDTRDWVEVNTTEKKGRYIKVVINDTEDANRDIDFGDYPYITIFDVYVREDLAIFMGANF